MAQTTKKKTTQKKAQEEQGAPQGGQGDMTVGDVRIQFLHDRLGSQAVRYESEINELQIRHLMEKQELLQEIERLKGMLINED